LFDKYLSKFGLQTDYVPLTNLAAWEAAIKPNTKALFLETPSNPLNEIADLAALSVLARQHDCLLIVDNCFCTPALLAAFVTWSRISFIHSATNILMGRALCGVVR